MIKEIILKTWKKKALNAFVQGNYESAEMYFFKIAEAYPHDPGINYNIGLVKLALKEYLKAEENFLIDYNKYGSSYNRSKTLGDLYYIWGNAEKANQYYSEALEECDQKHQKRFLMERISKCAAESKYNQVKLSHKNFEEGIFFQSEDLIEKAIQCYKDAIIQDNTNFQAANNLGSLLLNKENNPVGALKYFKMAATYSDLPGIKSNISKAQSQVASK